MAFPTTNCTQYWKLDESAGTNAANSVTGGTAGTFNLAPTWAAGKINNCSTGNGTQACSTIAQAGTAAFSVSFWFKSTTTADDTLCGTGDAGGNNGWYLKLRGATDDKIALSVYNGGWTIDASLCGALTYCDGNWHHVVCTFDGTNAWKVYIDNLDKTPPDSTGTLSGTNTLYLLARRLGDDKLPGSMDEFGYWTRVLSAAEVSSLYNGSSGESYPATGTNISLNIGNAWKTVSAAKINIGGTWKDVSAAKVNIGGTWKTIF